GQGHFGKKSGVMGYLESVAECLWVCVLSITIHCYFTLSFPFFAIFIVSCMYRADSCNNFISPSYNSISHCSSTLFSPLIHCMLKATSPSYPYWPFNVVQTGYTLRSFNKTALASVIAAWATPAFVHPFPFKTS